MVVASWLTKTVLLLGAVSCLESEIPASAATSLDEGTLTVYHEINTLSSNTSALDSIHSPSSIASDRDASKAVVTEEQQKVVNVVPGCTNDSAPIVPISNKTMAASSVLPSHSLEANSRYLETVSGDEDFALNDTDTTFLSFDEWKKEKLNQEAIQKPEIRIRSNGNADTTFLRADTIGDDLEIDLGLFTSGEKAANEEPEGKIYKDKFNYASLDCAATIVKTNSEASGANAVLHENKDKYLLTPCSAPNKFVVIELCQDILVEEIAMANYEFFSSTFRKVRFSVTDRFPPTNGWRILGEFDAANTRNIQKFEISNPLIWARYLRVEVLEHHGNEFYCPVSIIRVHGKTMIDDFKLDEANALNPNGISLQEANERDIEECRIKSLSSENATEKLAAENCRFPYLPNVDNINILPEVNLSSRCPAVLPHLKFDQFLKDINQSICDPIRSQPSLDLSTTMPSSSTEESIFKTIMKRLALLESNSTLSLRYIEEQSKLLSKAFSNLDKNQAKKFDSLVQAFNQSIVSNLGDINHFTQQLQESSFKLLEEQKLANDQFTSETFHRLECMKKDAIFQRRLSYTMLLAFVILLVYVLLTKEAYIDEYMEDDGWYLNSPPLKKVKDNFMRKTGRKNDTKSPLIFQASHESSELDDRSDLSDSSTSLCNDFATKSEMKDDLSTLTLRKARRSFEEEVEIDIDEAISKELNN